MFFISNSCINLDIQVARRTDMYTDRETNKQTCSLANKFRHKDRQIRRRTDTHTESQVRACKKTDRWGKTDVQKNQNR